MDPSILGAGGSADPMIRLHLSGEREKTLIKRKTLAPVWEETFAMKCDFTSEVLELTLWDFDVTSANDEIGAVYVPVSSMQDRQLHRAWYPVGPVASEDGLVDNLEPLSRHALKCGELVVSSGSVVDAQVSAIVNAANERCLGGSGVDGAITKAGGASLAEARKALPVLSDDKRCETGGAVLTSGSFGALRCASVIHAVGPDYRQVDLKKGDALLRSAYVAAMRLARENDCSTVAFSLLSAGIFRGGRSLDEVLHIAVEALRDSCYPSLERVHLVAFADEEQEVLKRVAAAPPVSVESSEAEYACEKGCGFTGSFGDVEIHEKTCAYEPPAPAPVETPRPVTPPRILPPLSVEPDWAKIAMAARSKVELLEARVRALERASPSKSRYYDDSSDESDDEPFFYTRTPYQTKKLPPLDTLPARSLSAALRRGRPLKREDYARQSLWQMLK